MPNLGAKADRLKAGGLNPMMDSQKGHATSSLVPTFKVRSIRDAEPGLLAAGASVAHRTIGLGKGKRVAGYLDPDQRHFRLIEFS